MDVYEHCVHAGVADGSGIVAMPPQPFPIPESAPLREKPYPGGSSAHDNVAMERALTGVKRITVLRPGAWQREALSVTIAWLWDRRDELSRTSSSDAEVAH